MSATILVSPCAETRLAGAAAWLQARDAGTEGHVTILGASIEAAAEVARRALETSGRNASFGWQRTTLGVLAVGIARRELAARGLVPVGGLALEAVCARVVHDHHRGSAKSKLGRFAPIGDLPGLPRALARTVAELRLASGGNDDAHTLLADADLARLVKAFEKELDAAGLADRARTLALATELVTKMSAGDIARERLGSVLLVDVPLRTRAERDFVAA
ncbi:MAG: ATP-dependent nuclease, subunit, partial [Labilithrix sp.]|nr:ATP-dependent nuclease, subunit [Labilithrix sp.]